MPTTLTDLHSAILHDPWDDALRLGYADLAEYEGGDRARAEFIRVQVEIAQAKSAIDTVGMGEFLILPESPKGHHIAWIEKEIAKLRRRERELLQHNWQEWHIPRDTPYWCKNLQTHVNDHLNWVEFRRGLVEVVSCRLVAWFGARCERCDGESIGKLLRCDICDNRGKVGGHGPAIVAAAPVVEVRVTDREPLRWTPDSGSGSQDWPDVYSWVSEDAPAGMRLGQEQATLPRELFKVMSLFIVSNSMYSLRFDTREAALSALSRACVDWARAKVGLPAMKWTT